MDPTRPSNPSRPSARFTALLPPAVATAELTAPDTPARLGEYSGGRLCARSAAGRLGAGDGPIGAHPDGRARWPRGLTGSITHTGGFAAAAVGERRRFRAIGIDAERSGSVSRELWPHVLTPPELRRVECLPALLQANLATLVFSAKEAFYKCQYEVTQQWLEFGDVVVDIPGPLLDRGRFSVSAAGGACRLELGATPVTGRYAFAGGLVLTAVYLDAR